jgi:hypothetical protein
MSFKEKYLKYKKKYLDLKGGLRTMPEGVNEGHSLFNKFFNLHINSTGVINQDSFIELLFASGFDATFYSTDEYQKLLGLLNDYNAIYVIDFANYYNRYDPEEEKKNDFLKKKNDINELISYNEHDIEDTKKIIRNFRNDLYDIQNFVTDKKNFDDMIKKKDKLDELLKRLKETIIENRKFNINKINILFDKYNLYNIDKNESQLTYKNFLNMDYVNTLIDYNISEKKIKESDKHDILIEYNKIIENINNNKKILEEINSNPYYKIKQYHSDIKKLIESYIDLNNENIKTFYKNISELMDDLKRLNNLIRYVDKKIEEMGNNAANQIIKHCTISMKNGLNNIYILLANTYNGVDPFKNYFKDKFVNTGKQYDGTGIDQSTTDYLNSHIIFLTGESDCKSFDDYLLWVVSILLSQFINKNNEISSFGFETEFITPIKYTQVNNINKSNSVFDDSGNIVERESIKILEPTVLDSGNIVNKLITFGLEKGPSLFIVTNDTQKLHDPTKEKGKVVIKNLYSELNNKNLNYVFINSNKSNYLLECVNELKNIFIGFNLIDKNKYYNQDEIIYEHNKDRYYEKNIYYTIDTHNNKIFYKNNLQEQPIYYNTNGNPLYRDNLNNEIHHDKDYNFYYKTEFNYDKPEAFSFKNLGNENYSYIFSNTLDPNIQNILNLELYEYKKYEGNHPIVLPPPPTPDNPNVSNTYRIKRLLSPFRIFAGLIYFLKHTYYSTDGNYQSAHSMDKKIMEDMFDKLKF